MLERQDTEEMLLSEEEFEREMEQLVLERMRNYLCEKLEPERFFPYLQSKQYLDTESCEQIRHAGTTKSRVNKMLDILIKSGQRPLIILIKAIRRCSTTQIFVAEKLKEEHKKIQENPDYVARREAIQSRTRLYPVLPPPPYRQYEQPPEYHIDCSEFSRSDSGDHNSGRKMGATQAYHGDNDATAGSPCGKDAVSPRKMLAGSDTYATPGSSVSVFDGTASHFQTSDFRTDIDPTIRDEILTYQAEKAMKFSVDGGNPQSCSVSDQGNKMRLYGSSQSDPSSRCSSNWQRPPRSPSEHDASMVSPRRSVSPSPVEDTDIAGRCPSFGEKSSASPTVRPKNCTSLAVSGSIQPSCFTSSNFGDDNTYNSEQRRLAGVASPRNFSGVTNGWLQSPTQGSKVLRTYQPVHNMARQFSNNLETIPSLESPSVPASETSGSINIRRPPIEHDDTSVMAPNQLDDDDDSSLEISTDSDNS